MNILEIFLQTSPALLYVLATLGTAIIYFFTAGLAYIVVQSLKQKESPLLLNKHPFKKENVYKELTWSLVSIAFFGFNALAIQGLVRTGLAQLSTTPFNLSSALLELFLFLVWNEIHFFIVHRLFHTPWLFRFHKIHHAQSNISPLSIFCFHPLEAIALGSVIPLILPFYNFHIETVFLFVLSSMLLNTWGHSGLNLFSSATWPEALRASQRHFDHHKFHKINFGFFFRIFDKWGKTSKENLVSKAGPSAVVALLLVLGDHAEAQRQIYGKRLLELDRYYHVTHFDLTYSPYTELEIKNLIEESEPLDISCDKDVLFLVGKKKQKTKSYRGLLYPQTNAQKIYMRFDDQNSKCTAKVMGYRIQINPEVDAHPSVAQLRSVTDRCQLNTSASSPLSLGCHLQTEDVEILANPYDALNARFKMLMGYELSYADYLKKDPRMPLDFSHTPQLDLVVFDTLQIMKDFVGTLHIRMLEHHLRQGAKVYITTSKALLLPHETGWLYELKRRYPEIHFRTYEKTPEKLNLKESFHSLHRNSHVKVLLTYSQEHPENNALIAGGRNASEMYFYAQQPDNSKYPEIIQWGSEPLYGWVYFNDLDFKVSGSSVTAALARSLMSYNEELPWNLSQEKIPAQNEEDTSNMSFFLSSPFAEGKGELEDVYVDLFNKAQDSIHIYSPYINFTKNIAQALNEAQRRGVRIDITTNLSVEGDFMPGILQPAMNKSIREVVKKYRIQYFSANKQIYHTKAVVIDNTMIVLGSINMNQRSFIHDTEIAFLFKDPKVLTQFERVFSHDIRPYVQKLTPEQIPRASLMELLVSPFMSVF